MKRIWIAVVLIALTVTCCISEQIYVKNFYTTIDTLAKEERPKELKEYWKEKNDTAYIFSPHDMLDELAQSINALDDDPNAETKKDLNYVRSINKVYYENQRITPSNIF